MILNIPLIIAADGHGACRPDMYKVDGLSDGLSDLNARRDNYVVTSRMVLLMILIRLDHFTINQIIMITTNVIQ